MRAPRIVFFAPLAAGLTACGAGIQAVYEGDVRFEHCMALDARPDIKPTIRRACWEEWVSFYTFGQTRDRVEYARLRERQLEKASDIEEGAWAPLLGRAAPAVPEPTTALAPPPMMMTSGDASAPVDAGAEAATAVVEAPPPGSECGTSCTEAWSGCRQECRTPACEKGCTGKFKQCMRRCF